MQQAGHNQARIAFMGFGEAAQAFLSGWSLEGAGVSAFDIKTQDPRQVDAMRACYVARKVDGGDTPGAALQGASVVFSTVTADQALAAAEAGAAGLTPGALWFDCNSCAPETKRRAAEVIGAAGGRYVDVAVMAPVHPRRHLVPLLVSGPHAAAGIAALEALGMRPQAAGDEIGRASSIKMLRSVMIKGMEALFAECLLSARRAGVEEAVLASFEASDPDIAWRARGSYTLERMMVHGARRAAEMREVARTVADLGLGGDMAAASALWQDRVAKAAAEPGEDALLPRLDRLLERL